MARRNRRRMKPSPLHPISAETAQLDNAGIFAPALIGYIAADLAIRLDARNIRHIRAAAYHPMAHRTSLALVQTPVPTQPDQLR